jgi:MYXO-CTERM domain-containing protein
VFDSIVLTAFIDALFRGQYRTGFDELATVDPATATPTAVGNIGFGVQELATDPISGVLYAATGAGVSGSGTGEDLATINTATGVGTIVASFTGISATARAVQGLAFTSDGTLYGTTFDFDQNNTPAFTINTATAVATPFLEALPTLERATGMSNFGGHDSGKLIANNGAGNPVKFREIDIANMTSTQIQTITLPAGFTRLKDLTEHEGQLYAILNDTGPNAASLVTVDVVAGTITQIGADGALGSSVHGLAGSPIKVDGSPCTDATECASGFCVDDVCCDTACDDDCESCVAADTAETDDGICAPVLSAVVCRAGSGDACDPNETCDGVNPSCPADVVTAAGTVCRAGSGDSCDPDEVCSGTPGEACPVDAVAAAGTVCRAGSGDTCDPDETCSGTALEACPSDVAEDDGTSCDAGDGPMSGECMSGMCEDLGTGGSGTGGSATGGSATGGSGGSDDTVVDDGCGCSVVGEPPAKRHGAWLVLLGAAIGLARRRRKVIG